MSAASRTSNPETLKGSARRTSSAGSEAGPTPLSLPDGETARSGRAPALVSRFRARESDRAKLINDISGPLFSGSSPSDGLQRSLENRLQELLEGNGSPLYELTWKKSDMLLGPPILQRRALEHRTPASECSGWPTPKATNNDNDQSWPHYNYGTLLGISRQTGAPRSAGEGVPRSKAGWQTPRARGDAEGTRAEEGQARNLEDQARMCGWATPTASEGKAALTDSGDVRPNGKRWGPRLAQQVLRLDLDDVMLRETGQQALTPGKRSNGSPADPVNDANCDRLNPDFVGWLMGYPPEWRAAAPRKKTPASKE